MDGERDLRCATGAELLTVLAAQQPVIATVQARVTQVAQRLGSSGGTGVPGTTPAAARRSKASGRPRRQRVQGIAHRRATPTQRVVHAAAHWPDCGTRLRGGWLHRRREVLELPRAPVAVVEHQIVARSCPLCQTRVLAADSLAGVVVGQSRLGVGLTSLRVTVGHA